MTPQPTYFALLVILFYASGVIDVTECSDCPKRGTMITPDIVGKNYSCNNLNSITSATSVIEWDNGLTSDITWDAIIAQVNNIKAAELIGNVTSGLFKDSKITITFIYPDITLKCTQPEGVTEVHGIAIGTIGQFPNLFYDAGSSYYSPGITNTVKPTNITYTDYITFLPLFPLYC